MGRRWYPSCAATNSLEDHRDWADTNSGNDFRHPIPSQSDVSTARHRPAAV